MNFLDELRHRNQIQDMTPGLEEHLDQNKPVTAYIGFDPTAPSLTIGNYVPIMLLKLFQLSGHQPIMLFGGATGRIGDPSGKREERTLKSYEEIENNLSRQQAQARKLLASTEGQQDVKFVDNYEFYKDFNVLDFLRDVGKTLTVNYMMSKDSVKTRLETGLSFTEFSYQLFQGYDFQRLYKDYGCTLEMGGSDQWGNITSGTEFVRRNLNEKAYGLTAPLLTKADGSKFGKSEAGNIWLDPEMTSPYQFYQFWINADDRDIATYIRTFTLQPREVYDQWIKDSETEPRRIKELLAEEMTARIHGEKALKTVRNVSEMLFNRKASQEQLRGMGIEDLQSIAREIPSATIAASLLREEGTSLVDVLVNNTDLFSSLSEARRAVKGNAVSVNKLKVADDKAVLCSADLLCERYVMIENGKKNKLILEIAE